MTEPRTDQPPLDADAPNRPASEAADGDQMGGPVDDVQYVERLRTPLWWYLAAVLVGLLMASEFLLASSGWITYLPFAVLVPGSVALVWRLSSATVAVSDGTLRVGDRSLPLTGIERGIALNPAQLRMLVGRHSDPLAFDFIRSWIGPGVQLVLREAPTSDPADREPYWVLSTRHPDRLLAALAAGPPAD